MSNLVSPSHQGNGSTCVASMVSKRSDSTAGSVVSEEFNIVEKPVATDEPREVLFPPLLALVAVSEVDVRVRQGVFITVRPMVFTSSLFERCIPSDSANSFNPTMMYSFGACSHGPVATRVAPTFSNSSP